jgi:assimilatory nitrate reductase catalytic subunit
MHEVKSTCCYCGVGCGVIIESDGERITGVRGDPEHPANFGRLCTKGATLHLTTARRETRAHFPELRRDRATARQRTSWDEALNSAADKFAAIIKEHGPDAVGFYISGQLLTEDYYVFNKLAKGLIGTNNVDTNSRLCMSSAVAGYKATLGVDAPPTCYEDIAHAGCIFIAGSNTAYAHPIVFRRIEDARRANPELKVIVVDPRRTDTAQSADLHLPILPGTDVALFNGMLHVMLWEDLCDMDYIRAHTEGFDALKATVREYTPAAVAGICGVPAEDIITAAKWFGIGPTLSLYCQGLNQSVHGTAKNGAIINLHLATGQIGKPGAGPFSLTGQPNAMGGREVGGMANLLSAHRDLANPEHRAEIAQLWGIDSVPEKPGKTAVEMFEAAARGEIKALWIACTNPAQSLPNQTLVRQALEKAEMVVLQEAYTNTDTAAFADILLPASSWGEKEGTVTNSERRISHVRPAIPAPGEARADWEIVVDFGRRLGQRLNNPHTESLLPYSTPEAIFNEHRESTRGRDLDITGLSYALLDESGPQQWPFPEGATQGAVRLYGDGVFPTPTGRARFANVRYAPPSEQTDARHPLHLNTGRLRDQWHGMSRSGTVARLFNHVEEPLLAMHADDMHRRGLKHGDLAQVKSRRGTITVRVEESPEMRPAQVFMPMHWGSQFMNNPGCNALTTDAFDPYSKQPELKHAAVQVSKLNFGWHMVAMRRGDAGRLAQLQPLLAQFGYATCGLYGRDEPVVVLRVADEQPPAAEVIAELDRILALDDDSCAMTYLDAKRGVSKRVLVQDGMVVGARLMGETAARDWLKDLMAEGAAAEAVRAWVLAPLSTPPVGSHKRGRIVCNCLDVSALEIEAELAHGCDLVGLQDKLKCGTECGSCVPELKRLVAARQETTT